MKERHALSLFLCVSASPRLVELTVLGLSIDDLIVFRLELQMG